MVWLSGWLAWRYSRSGSGFFSFVSAIAALGLALGTAVLVVVLSVMNGFDRELRERVLGALPHAVLYADAGIEDWRGLLEQVTADERVLAAAPLAQGTALVAATERVLAVELTGIDPHYERDVSIVGERMRVGSLDDLQAGAFQLVIGARLAAQLGVEVGDSVVIVMPDPRITLAGAFPRQKRMQVSGIFELGSELDDSGVYTHLDDARRLLRVPAQAEGLRLRVADLFTAGQVVEDLLLTLSTPGLRGYDWSRTHGNLYAAIGLQKRIMFVLLSLLIAVAAFNVVSMLTMVVGSKRGDIAILRTMGMVPRDLVRVFFLQGSLIALVGVGLGLLVGVLFALALPTLAEWLQALLGQRLLDEYFVRDLPVAIALSDLAAIAAVGTCIALFVTWWPARRVLRIEPAEELRHE